VFPPEREKEAEVRRVNREGGVASRKGRCRAGDGGRNSGSVSRDGLVLFFTSELNFRASPGRGPRGAGLHDERDTVPQAVDVGAAELMGAAEFSLDGGPMAAELEEHSAAADIVEEGATGESLEPGGTTSDGECEAALDGVEVCSVSEGELELVPKRCANGRVEQGGGAGLLAGLLQLEALVRR
jgi:hypothetical protein